MAAMCSRRCCWLLALTAVFALGMPAAFAQDGTCGVACWLPWDGGPSLWAASAGPGAAKNQG